MNEAIKFGHRVLARDYEEEEYKKGKFVSLQTIDDVKYHDVLLDGTNAVETFYEVKLDPDATEFLPGDEVEMSDDKVKWELDKYSHKSLVSDKHFGRKGNLVNYCRYPKKDPFDNKIIQINEKIYQLKEMPNVIYKNPPLVRINLPCES